MREDGGRIINYSIDDKGQTDDVGEYTTFVGKALPWTLRYLKEVTARRRYVHRIWPEHCLVGTPGHNIVAPLMEALLEWSVRTNATVNFVTKGSNPCVEHFSAVRAEVPFDGDATMGLRIDPTTQLNAEFIQEVMEADEILLAGAGGCLVNTVQDVASMFSIDDSFLRKCVFLTDGTTPEYGSETFHLQFVNEMVKRGMTVTTTDAYLA
jgi:nicotinamidase-related amidase